MSTLCPTALLNPFIALRGFCCHVWFTYYAWSYHQQTDNFSSSLPFLVTSHLTDLARNSDAVWSGQALWCKPAIPVAWQSGQESCKSASQLCSLVKPCLTWQNVKEELGRVLVYRVPGPGLVPTTAKVKRVVIVRILALRWIQRPRFLIFPLIMRLPMGFSSTACIVLGLVSLHLSCWQFFKNLSWMDIEFCQMFSVHSARWSCGFVLHTFSAVPTLAHPSLWASFLSLVRFPPG